VGAPARSCSRSLPPTTSKTGHPKIFVGHVKGSNLDALVSGMKALLKAADGTDERAVYEGLRRLIPESTGAQTEGGARTDDGAGKQTTGRGQTTERANRRRSACR